MLLDSPTVLVHEYIQRMMAWLLFVELESLPKMQAMQLGLGAGSLTKYCHKVLRMKVCAIELNPQVVIACRGWFKLPPDNPRMRVVLADAALEIRNPVWRSTVDALQVDLYDHEAAAPVLDSESFYRDCRRLLSPNGCMTVNLFGRSSSFVRSLGQIAAAFGDEAVWTFKATHAGNTVVVARNRSDPVKRATLAAKAEIIQTQWSLPARQWARILKPLAI